MARRNIPHPIGGPPTARRPYPLLRWCPVVCVVTLVGCVSTTKVDSDSSGGTGPGGAPTTGGRSSGGHSAGGVEAGGTGGFAGDVSCGDTRASPTNCGACGHDCRGGACLDGVCQPVLLAQARGNVGTIIVTSTQAYWAGWDAQAVRRCSLTGCPEGPEVLVAEAGPVVGLAMDAGSLYWTVWESADQATPGAIRKCVLPACKGPLTLVTGLRHPNHLALNNTTAYWMTYFDAYVGRVAKGASGEDFGPGHVLAENQSQATAIVLHDGGLYWSVTGHNAPGISAIRRCPLPDCAAGPEAVVDGLPNVRDLVVAGNDIVWADADAGQILACALPDCSGGPRTLVDGLTTPRSLAVDDTSLYYGFDSGIERCTLPECADRRRVVVTQELAQFVAVGPSVVAYQAGDNLYFVAR